jgi:5-methylcytosine-specific restriction endonuclease McrA
LQNRTITKGSPARFGYCNSQDGRFSLENKMINENKKCSKCGRPGEFRKGKNVCKLCNAERAKRWQEANPEKQKANVKRWREANPEKVKADAKRWQEANPEKHKANSKRWYDANPEKRKANDKRWREANPEKVKAYVKRWQEANPEKRAALDHARRTRVAGNGGRYTAQEWKDLCNHYGNRCLSCGRTDVKLTVDHVIPLKLGGVNTIENLQPLCKNCNSSKGASHRDYRPILQPALFIESA